MKRYSRLFAFFLAVVIFINLDVTVFAVESMDNFSRAYTYLNGQFTDVKTSDWFNNNVAKAYELGLMQGESNTTFKPYDDVTLAETITLACRIFSIYNNDGEKFPQDKPWYQVYIDYALKNKILAYGYVDYNKSATRGEVVQILSQALPVKEFKVINKVENGAIPDVTKDFPYTPYVYLFYRAGILSGNDSMGSFNPNNYIKRNEVSAIVSRMVDINLRKHFDLRIITADTISINTNKVKLETGKQMQLTATISPLETTDKTITWSSSMPNVASVSNDGVITTHNTGITQITAKTTNGRVSTCSVSVPMKRSDENGTSIIQINPVNDSTGVFLKWNYITIAFNKNVKSIKSDTGINLINLSTGEYINVISQTGTTAKNCFLVTPTYFLPLDTTYSLYIPNNSIQMADGTLYGEDIFFIFKTAKTVVIGTVTSSNPLETMNVVLKSSDGKNYPASIYSETKFFVTDIPEGEYSVFVLSKNCGTILVYENQIYNVTIKYD